MTTYVLARLIPAWKRIPDKTLEALRRFGAPVTFFAWLPIVGDALCAAAGWLRIRWWAALAFMAAGRLARYIVVAALS
jgi:membrane protein YqaA with SNARE-associated domain